MRSRSSRRPQEGPRAALRARSDHRSRERHALEAVAADREAYRDAVDKKDDRKLYYESLEEHQLVDLMLEKLDRTDPTAPEFGARATLLKELIEHHADEEEEEMFPRARRAIGAGPLQDLGARMATRRQDLHLAGAPRRDKRKAAQEE